jgi:hypothetical protein
LPVEDLLGVTRTAAGNERERERGAKKPKKAKETKRQRMQGDGKSEEEQEEELQTCKKKRKTKKQNEWQLGCLLVDRREVACKRGLWLLSSELSPLRAINY